MVKLRLKQTGKKNARTYRIVAADSRGKRDGKDLEIIGYYDPRDEKSKITFNIKAAERWIADGAQMTERVEKLFKLVKDNKVEA